MLNMEKTQWYTVSESDPFVILVSFLLFFSTHMSLLLCFKCISFVQYLLYFVFHVSCVSFFNCNIMWQVCFSSMSTFIVMFALPQCYRPWCVSYKLLLQFQQVYICQFTILSCIFISSVVQFHLHVSCLVCFRFFWDVLCLFFFYFRKRKARETANGRAAGCQK